MQPIHFQVGKPFPIPEYRELCQGIEQGLPVLTDTCFNALLFLNAEGNDLHKFQENNIEYGIVAIQSIPLLIIRVNGLIMIDSFLNFQKFYTPAQQQTWLESDANLVTLFAIHARTGILEGMRIIGVAPDFMKRLKFYAQQQIEKNYSSEEIDAIGHQLQAQLTPHDIWAKCFKYRHSEATEKTKGKRKKY